MWWIQSRNDTGEGKPKAVRSPGSPRLVTLPFLLFSGEAWDVSLFSLTWEAFLTVLTVLTDLEGLPHRSHQPY